MANRVYFASQGLSLDGATVQGAQSVGISVNYSTEQAFQLGRLAIYDNIITDGEVTVTATKNIDGSALMYDGSMALAASGLHTLIISSSTSEEAPTSDTGSAISTKVTGAYLSSVSYTFPVDGWATEECSWIGDNKSVGTDQVAAPTASAENAYRHHISWGGVHGSDNVTNISIRADLGREAMFKLGTFRPYHRFANFPVEVTVEFTVANTATEGTEVALTGIDCTDEGVTKTDITVSVCDANNNSGTAAYTWTMEDCLLSAISQDGGDTGGGSASTTYTYTTYNSLTVT